MCEVPEVVIMMKYDKHRDDIGKLLDLIAQELRVFHATKADKPDLGDVLFIGRIRDGLENILRSLLITQYNWGVAEANHFIECGLIPPDDE